MSQFSLQRRHTWTNTGVDPRCGNSRALMVPSSVSNVWFYSSLSSSSVERAQTDDKTLSRQTESSVVCGVCQKLDCQLRSHRTYLWAKNLGSRYEILNFGSTDPCEDPRNTKPKAVDDLVIRNAFTQSYAFTEPSYLSNLQPSSFRLDVFHNLPVLGGNQYELHKLLWNFLNQHLHMLFKDGSSLQNINMDEVQGACLAAALTDPITCWCILAIETMIRSCYDNGGQNRHTLASAKTFQKYIKSISESATNESVHGIPDLVRLQCARLMLKLQAGSAQTPKSTIPATSVSENSSMGDNKLPRFSSVVDLY